MKNMQKIFSILILAIISISVFSTVSVSARRSRRSSNVTIIPEVLSYNSRSDSIFVSADFETIVNAEVPREVKIDLDRKIPVIGTEEWVLVVQRCGYLNPYGNGIWVSVANIHYQEGYNNPITSYYAICFVGENGIYEPEIYSDQISVNKRCGFYNVNIGEDFAFKPVVTENGIVVEIRNSNGYRDQPVYRFYYDIEENIYEDLFDWKTWRS